MGDREDLLKKVTEPEKRAWEETHRKQQVHDLAKEAEEQRLRNIKREEK